MKKIAILGASGSIGTNTLNVLRNHQDKFSLVDLAPDSPDINAAEINFFKINTNCCKNYQ